MVLTTFYARKGALVAEKPRRRRSDFVFEYIEASLLTITASPLSSFLVDEIGSRLFWRFER